jgi:hypothetical protein
MGCYEVKEKGINSNVGKKESLGGEYVCATEMCRWFSEVRVYLDRIARGRGSYFDSRCNLVSGICAGTGKRETGQLHE